MESINRKITVQACWGHECKSLLKNTKAKRAGGMAQMVEHLPGNSSTLTPSKMENLLQTHLFQENNLFKNSFLISHRWNQKYKAN
jgi:hypothetical protein